MQDISQVSFFFVFFYTVPVLNQVHLSNVLHLGVFTIFTFINIVH